MNSKRLVDISDLFKKSNLLIRDKIVPAGEGVNPHWHNYFELEIIAEGKAEHIYNGNKYIAEKGSAHLLSYCDFHSFWAVEDVHLLNLRFKENLLPEELANQTMLKPNKLFCTFSKKELSDAEEKIKLLQSEVKNPSVFGQTLISSVVCELVISIIRKSGAHEFEETSSPVIQQALAYINSNFREKLTLTETANHLSVSVNYLGTLFKKYLKTNFNEYLNQTRLKYACGLLSSPDLTVKEIAYASGYGSTEYFSYIFKRKMGVTPNEFRQAAYKQTAAKQISAL